jgi:xanthine dehydrogenase small subunit
MPVEPSVVSPTDLEGAYLALVRGTAEAPIKPIAGGTDLMVAINGELGPPPASVVDLWAIEALRGVSVDGDTVSLGALTTYSQIRRSPICREHISALVEAAASIGAPQIQNRGTLGGNIANASPAGDTLPVLLAVDARFVLGSVRGEREVAAAAFWTGYRTTAMAHDELIVRVLVPVRMGRRTRYRKVGTRRAQAISKVVAAVGWREARAADRTVWRDVRVALGSVAATPIRAVRTEAVLEGSPPTPEVADRAAEALAAELSPIDDVRSTAGYRRVVAARVLHRIVRDAGGW